MNLWDRVRIGTSTECWPYEGPRSEDGYGIVGRQGKAHRLAYVERCGPIPEGMHVLHHCDTPPCCNPAHLFLGTNHDNVLDRHDKGRSFLPSRRVLSSLGVATARKLRSNGVIQQAIADQLGVSRGHIAHITAGCLPKNSRGTVA